jgi:hypothetical protein
VDHVFLPLPNLVVVIRINIRAIWKDKADNYIITIDMLGHPRIDDYYLLSVFLFIVYTGNIAETSG